MRLATPPFVIVVVGDFSGWPPRAVPAPRHRRLITVSASSFGVFFARAKEKISAANTDIPLVSLNWFDPGGAPAVDSPLCERLKATCHGLRFLVQSVAGLPNVKIKVWDISQKELLRDQQRAPAFDQSAFFKKIYEEGLDTFGGEPPGLLLGDYYLSSSLEDLELAERASSVAAAASAPFAFGISPEFLPAPSWENMNPRFLSAWIRLSRCEDSAMLASLLPRWSLPNAVAGRVWLNPVYLAAAAAARAFAGGDIAKAAAKLFPDWASKAGRIANTGTVEIEPDFEWDCPEELMEALGPFGFNVLSAASVRGHGFLHRIAPVRQKAGAQPTLARALLVGRMYQAMRDHIRVRMGSMNLTDLQADVERWARSEVEDDSTGARLLPFENPRVGVAHHKLGSWLNLDLDWAPQLRFLESFRLVANLSSVAPVPTHSMVHAADVSVVGRQAAIMRVELASEGTPGLHTHPGDEIGYVLQGEGEILIEGQPPRKVKVGDGFVIQAGLIHDARNTGAEPLKLVTVYVVEKDQPLITPVA